MEWFVGGIPEAIGAAKSGNAIFVVYIHDSSDASKATDEALAQKDILATLNSENFVAILLENGTEDAKQFSQIYPLVLVPSLFFINGQTGMPMEVMGGPLTADTLQQKLDKLVPNKEVATNDTSPTDQSSEAVSELDASSNQPEVRQQKQDQQQQPEAEIRVGATAVTEDTKEAVVETNSLSNTQNNEQLPDVTAEESGASEDTVASSLSLDEKVERAKVLVAEKQAAEARIKAEESRQKEVDRRKSGQGMARHRQLQEEENLKAVALERKKDKEEDRLARERVKAQIATDRAEREARDAMLRGEQQPSGPDIPSAARPPPQPSPAPSSSNISRLKFRLPDGSSSIAQFPAEATLGEVRSHIQENMSLPYSTFTLASTVHQGAFSQDEDNTSLRDLGLIPSAILAILPSGRSSGVGRIVSRSGDGSDIWDLLWLLLSPITFLLGIVKRLVGIEGGEGGERRTASGSPGGPPEPKRAREEGSATTRNRPSTAYGNRGEGRLRREGNIYRFSNPDDEDDENNTWNGNSTQQM